MSTGLRGFRSTFFAASAAALATLLSACGGGSSGDNIPSIDLAGYSRYLANNGTTVYVGDARDRRVHVVDASNPGAPRLVATLAGAEVPRSLSGALEVSGTTLYVGNFDLVRVLDVTNPASPIERATIPTPGGSIGSDLQNQILYIGTQGGGLRIVDISTPASPQLLSTVPASFAIQQVAVQGNVVYFTDGSSLVTANVSDPANPAILGSVSLGSVNVIDIDVAGNLAFVATSVDGMRIVDVSNPASPQLRGRVASLDSTIGVAAGRAGRAYMADARGGMVVVDVSDPVLPRALQNTAINGEILSLLRNGNSLYAAGGDSGFGIFDITTPFSGRPATSRSLPS